MALHIVQVEEIQALLRRTPAIVNLYESKSPGFVEAVAAWLKQAETVLEHNRLHQVSRLSQQRAMLLAARRGIRPPGLELEGRGSPRKIAEAAALRALRDGCETVNELIAVRSAEIGDAGRALRQALAIARIKRLMPPADSALSQHELSGLRARLAGDSDIAPYYVAAAGMVAEHDLLILMDRLLCETAPGDEASLRGVTA